MRGEEKNNSSIKSIKIQTKIMEEKPKKVRHLITNVGQNAKKEETLFTASESIN